MDKNSPELTATTQAEVLRLLERCKKEGFDHAARFLFRHNQEIVEIGIAAKLEPKARDLPSPFVYSMQ